MHLKSFLLLRVLVEDHQMLPIESYCCWLLLEPSANILYVISYKAWLCGVSEFSFFL